MEHDLVARAREYAVRAHERIDQRRKYSGQPYETHLQAVAAIVASVSDDPETLAAAWLHDVVEDTPATIEDVLREFGPGVAKLVDALTDVSRPSDGNRAARKAIDRDHLAVAPPRAKTIKLADLIDNCNDICQADPRFATVFLAEATTLLDVLGTGDPRLMDRARQMIGNRNIRLSANHAVSPELLEPQTGPHQNEILDVILNRFEAKDLGRGIRQHRGWKPSQTVKANASFIEVVDVLTRHQICIVEREGQESLQVRRDDFNSPLARMWLFGILTSIELDLKWHIRRSGDKTQWSEALSPGRHTMIEKLMAERHRRNQPCDLIDCLQLSDLFSVILHQAGLPGALGFKSRKTAKRVFADMEILRNHVAHSQVICEELWPTIARLARHLNSANERGG